MELDKQNGSTLWSDANVLEHEKLRKYDVFIDKGRYHVSKVPQVYQKINVHTKLDVKHVERHHAQVVADGHLTEVPTESIYSGVVSLQGLCACIFIGELNGTLIWGTDISSAYLCAKTSEKVCIEAGSEFGSQTGQLLIVDKVLYGLRLSGKAFNQLLIEVLCSLGFKPSRAEPSIYIRPCPDPTKDIYKYIVSYVNNLCYVISDPEKFLEDLKHNSMHLHTPFP